jgi:hypothetical protein
LCATGVATAVRHRRVRGSRSTRLRSWRRRQRGSELIAKRAAPAPAAQHRRDHDDNDDGNDGSPTDDQSLHRLTSCSQLFDRPSTTADARTPVFLPGEKRGSLGRPAVGGQRSVPLPGDSFVAGRAESGWASSAPLMGEGRRPASRGWRMTTAIGAGVGNAGSSNPGWSSDTRWP